MRLTRLLPLLALAFTGCNGCESRPVYYEPGYSQPVIVTPAAPPVYVAPAPTTTTVRTSTRTERVVSPIVQPSAPAATTAPSYTQPVPSRFSQPAAPTTNRLSDRAGRQDDFTVRDPSRPMGAGTAFGATPPPAPKPATPSLWGGGSSRVSPSPSPAPRAPAPAPAPRPAFGGGSSRR